MFIIKKPGRIALRLAALIMAVLLLPISAFAEGALKVSSIDDAHTEADECGVKTPTTDLDFSFIKVLITTGSTGTVKLKLYGNYYIGTDRISLNGTASAPYVLTVTTYNGEAYAKNSSGTTIAHAALLELKRVYLNHDAGYAVLYECASSSTEGKSYLGNFIFSSTSDGVLRMVNNVPLAHYCYGIVSYEMNYAFEPAALRAQAVAAKCYGMSYINTNDVYYSTQDGFGSATSCQSYRGYSTNANRLTTLQYCVDVAGVALSYADRIIPTFYGATDGGETALPSHAFGGSNYDAAYGVRLDDYEFEYITNRRETISITFGSAPEDNKFCDFILCKIRDALTYAPNSVISIDEMYAYDPVEGTERNMQRVYVKATVGYPDGNTAVREIDFAATQLSTYTLSDLDYSGNYYTTSNHHVFMSNYEMYWGREVSSGYELYFCRHGHGVGLSQLGANVYADPEVLNWDYRQILQFYYANFDLIDITEANPESPLSTSDTILAYGVCTASASFYVGGSTAYNTIGTVSANEHIDIIGIYGGYYQAIWDGHFGYINKDNVEITMFPSPADAVFTVHSATTISSVNLRTAPFSSAGLITNLPAGTSITIWVAIGGWYYVETPANGCGFLSGAYVSITSTYQVSGVALINKAPQTVPRPAASLKRRWRE